MQTTWQRQYAKIRKPVTKTKSNQNINTGINSLVKSGSTHWEEVPNQVPVNMKVEDSSLVVIFVGRGVLWEARVNSDADTTVKSSDLFVDQIHLSVVLSDHEPQ